MVAEVTLAAAFVRVELTLLPADESGRSLPLWSGYRGMFWIGSMEGEERAFNDAAVLLEDIEELAPGSSATARLQPAVSDYWQSVAIDDVLELHEGRRVVGTARVIELFPDG